MYHRRLSLIIVFLVAGCAGLDVKTLKSHEVKDARAKGGAPLSGYIVYEPMVIVSVSWPKICIGTEEPGGACKGQLVTHCAASTLLLPDYEKPYLVSTRAGLGKAGAEVTIVDGWMLGTLKDSSDNAALVSALASFKSSPATVQPSIAKKDEPGCKLPGLYRLVFKDGLPNLVTFP
jgi:hypothetical protein